MVNEDQVAENLFSCLQQFYTVFPDLLNNELYITGESYAGHYVPAIAYKIRFPNGEGEEKPENDDGNVEIPLAGIAIGDGWVDPVNMVPQYANLMSVLGLADGDQVNVIENYVSALANVNCILSIPFFLPLPLTLFSSPYSKQDQIVAAIEEEDYEHAFRVWDKMLNGDLTPYVDSTLSFCPPQFLISCFSLSFCAQIPQLLSQHHPEQ